MAIDEAGIARIDALLAALGEEAARVGMHRGIRAEAKSVGIEFLDKSKSFVYFVLYAPKELIDFSYNTFYKPHEDKGIWKIEEVFDISLNLDVDVEEKIITEFSKSYVKHLGNNGDK